MLQMVRFIKEDDLHVDKLKIVPVDLKKLSDVVSKESVNKTKYYSK